MPGVGVDHRDHPVLGDPAGDPPRPTARRRLVLDPLDVLTGDQRQQRQRLSLLRIPLEVGKMTEQPVRISDQRIHDRGPGLHVVPGDRRLAGIVVLVRRTQLADHRGGAGDVSADPTDRCDQLRHRVPGGDRIIEDGGVQRPPGPAGQHPGLGHHRPHRVEDPVRRRRRCQSPPPVGQRRGMKRTGLQRQPCRSLPPQVERHRLRRLPVGQTVQRRQHDHRCDHVRRDRRPPPTRPEQVREQLVTEQLPAVCGQKREHTTSGEQVPHPRLHITELDLILRPSLHPHIVPQNTNRSAQRHQHCSAGS